MKNKLNVAVIGYVWPEPNSSAAGQNMLSLIMRCLDANFNVTFLTAATDSEHKADLEALGVQAHSVALNCSSFNTLIARLNPDVVIFDRYMTEEHFSWRVKESCPEALRILNTEDLTGVSRFLSGRDSFFGYIGLELEAYA